MAAWAARPHVHMAASLDGHGLRAALLRSGKPSPRVFVSPVISCRVPVGGPLRGMGAVMQAGRCWRAPPVQADVTFVNGCGLRSQMYSHGVLPIL